MQEIQKEQDLLTNCNFTLCPEQNCFKVPFIKIIESSLPDKLKIECDCQKDKESGIIKPMYMKISDYLKIQKENENPTKCLMCEQQGVAFCLSDKQWYCQTDKVERIQQFDEDNFISKKVELDIKCEEHPENTLTTYCQLCQKHLCEECQQEHEHQVSSKQIDIEELKNQFQYKLYLQNLKNENYLSRNEHLKNEMISRLEKQIELIKKAFEKNKEINENIKNLIKNILFTYKEIFGEKEEINNCQLITNVMYNCTFNEPNVKLHSLETSLENINKLINYYNTSFIFGAETVKINNFYNVKTIKAESIKNAGTLTTLSNGKVIFCNKGLHVLSYNENDTTETFYTIQNENKKLLLTTALCEIDNDHLVTGTSNGNIYIWKMDKDESNKINLQQIYEGENENEEIIQIIKISSGSFAAVTRAKIYVYSFAQEENGDFIIKNDNSSKKQPLVLQDKDGLAFTALIKPKNLPNTLISGSNEGAVKVWDIEKNESEKVKEIQCNSKNAFIEVENNIICIGSLTNVILLDYTNWKEKKVITEKIIKNEGIVQEICMILPTRVNNYFLLSGMENVVHLLEIINNGGNIIINKNENNDFDKKKTLISIVNWGKRCALISDQEGSVIMWNY